MSVVLGLCKIFGYDWAFRVVDWLFSIVLGKTYTPSIYKGAIVFQRIKVSEI